jgi:hypothetical protein
MVLSNGIASVGFTLTTVSINVSRFAVLPELSNFIMSILSKIVLSEVY